MKKLLFIIFLSPFTILGQTNTIDLTEYGLNATLSNPDNMEYEIRVKTEDGTRIYKVDINDHTIKINDYAKPMTAKQVMDIYFSMPETKSKNTTFKILEKGTNKVVLEANYSGSIKYLFFYSYVAKGKQIVVECTGIKGLEICKNLQKIGESFKFQ